LQTIADRCIRVLGSINTAHKNKMLLRLCISLAWLLATAQSSRHVSMTLQTLGTTGGSAADCKDGVCSLPGATGNSKAAVVDLESKVMKEWKDASGSGSNDGAVPTSNAAATTPAAAEKEPQDAAEKIGELGKMGWKADEAKSALAKSNWDIGAAASLLETEQEEKQIMAGKVKEVSEHGWNEDAAEAAIRQCEGNVTMALDVLQKEEDSMVAQFESAVKDMVRS
jgi:hypothetical protein